LISPFKPFGKQSVAVLIRSRSELGTSETGYAFFLGKIIPFPKLIRDFFRIAAIVKQFPEGELGCLTHERSRAN
jgi:hypothetical protein